MPKRIKKNSKESTLNGQQEVNDTPTIQSPSEIPGCTLDEDGVPWCNECGHVLEDCDCPIHNSKIAKLASTASARHTNEEPLWQGPCASGASGGITQSMIGKFLSCRERFRLRCILGLEPHDKWNHRMGYGNMWHVCEHALASNDGLPWNARLMEHAHEQSKKYPLQVEEIAKWWEVCATQFPEYIKYWSEHPDVRNRTPLLQEQVFDVLYTLPSGRVVRLRGRWDSVDLITDETEGKLGRHANKSQGIYLQENKTKADIDKMQIERQLKFDLQTMLYLIALQECQTPQYIGKLCQAQVKGVRYNVVRRPLSGGKGNITPHKAKSTKTKVTPAETPEQFYERLRRDYIAKEPDYWFFRIRCEITPQDIKVFKDTCLDPLLETICWWYDQITNNLNTKQILEGFRGSMNYRTPFGIYSSLEEGGATEYDSYMESGSEAGLRRINELFTELK